MKSIYNYITESIESDNLLWMLDKWFDMHENERQEFMEIIFQCQKDKGVTNIEKYLENSPNIYQHYKEFVSFLLDEVNIPKDIDYIYQFKEIIKTLMANKSSKNKYNKMPNII